MLLRPFLSCLAFPGLALWVISKRRESHLRANKLPVTSENPLSEPHQPRHGISPSDPNEVETSFRVLSGKIEKAPDVNQPLLFLAVVTARSYTERRKDVRSSWWQHPSFNDGSAKASFFIGEADPADMSADVVSTALAMEKQAYNDIVDLPIKDTYDNLSRKTGAIFDWFAREKPARFLAKIDDDTFPHFNVLLPSLRTMKSEDVYMGLLFNKGEVQRTGKWAEKVYDRDMFPWYMNGAGYILDSSLVSKIVEMQDRVFLTNEDAGVGLWVSLLGIPEDHYIPVESTEYGCKRQDVFSQNLKIGAMHCMWQSSGCCA